MVLFSPEDHRVTSGAPAERRQFLDVLLSQADRQYLQNLQQYSRVLRQRNRLLIRIADGLSGDAELAVWDERFAPLACELMQRRQLFLASCADQLSAVYERISGLRHNLTARYEPSTASQTPDPGGLLLEMRQLRAKELARRRTLVGPHRDDLALFLGDRDVRRHASRGEQKSVLLALKTVEFVYLKVSTGKTPLYLLDDLYSELDEKRQLNTISNITGLGQAFISATGHSRSLAAKDLAFFVKLGSVEPRP